MKIEVSLRWRRSGGSESWQFHRGVVDGDDGPRVSGEKQNVFLCVLPMFHVVGLAVILYSQLQIGNAVVSMTRFELEDPTDEVTRLQIGVTEEVARGREVFFSGGCRSRIGLDRSRSIPGLDTGFRCRLGSEQIQADRSAWIGADRRGWWRRDSAPAMSR